VSAGSLPPGFALSSTGTLSGTGTQVGSFNFTIQAQDSTTGTGSPFFGQQNYTLNVNPPVIVLAPANLPLDVSGTLYTQPLTPSGGTAPYSNFTITAGSPPTGITLDPNTGVLSGTTTGLGSFTFTVQVQDSTAGPGAPYKGIQSFTLQVVEPFAPATLPDAQAGASYSQAITAVPGTGPATNFQVTGALPNGVTLSSTGVLTGTPTQVGSFSFTVSADDTTPANGSFTATQSFTLAVDAPVISFTPTSLSAATAGAAYSQTLTATGGNAPYSNFVTIGAGTLPSGMQLSPTGTLSGTPTEAGTFNFTIRAQDSTTGPNQPYTGSQAFSLTVNPPNITFSPSSLSPISAGVAFSQSLTAGGGNAPYSGYTIASGSLPNGLTFSNTGLLSGTPTQVGSFTFTVKAQDSTTGTGAPFTGQQTYNLVVNAPTIVLGPANLTATAGASYGQSITASGGTAPYSGFTITSGSLPAGLTFASSGTFSGTPTQVGTFNLTIKAQDSTTGTGSPFFGTQNFTLTVKPPVFVFTPATLDPATAGATYTQPVSISGGNAPYSSFVLGAGSALPAGMTLSPTGVISGTPTQAGTFIVIVQNHDSTTGLGAPFTGKQTYTLTVNGPNIVLTPSTLPGATAGATYSVSLGAGGGTPTYSHFTVSNGALPGGLSLSQSGLLFGTPTAAGTFNFTIKAQDSTTGPAQPYSGSQSYSLVIAAPQIGVSPSNLPAGEAYLAYNQTLAGTGGTAPYSNFTISNGALPTGMSLSSGGVLSGTPTVAGNFTFTVQVQDSTTGPNIPYTGSQNYTLNIATDPVRVTVNTSALPSAVTDQVVTFAATLTSAGPAHQVPQGNVDFVVDGTTIAANVPLSASGVATATDGNLKVDSPGTGSPHPVTVVFHDTDGLFNDGATGILPGGQAVVAANTTTTLSSSAPAGAGYGTTVTITATVTAQAPSTGTASGFVTFFVDNVAQGSGVQLAADGTATFTTNSLTVNGSPHVIQAVYGATTDFTFSTGPLSGGQKITPADTQVQVSSSANPSRPNEPVTFTANVTSAVQPFGGTVTFYVDNVARSGAINLVNGQASFTISTLTVSSTGHNVQAKYSGATNFKAQTGSMSQVVAAAGTTKSTTTITPSESPGFFGDTITFTAGVTGAAGTPSGAVTFTIDNVSKGTFNLDANGQATFEISTLTVTTHTVRVSYYGDNTYAASSASLSEVVKQAQTNTQITSSATPVAVVGNPVTWTATVTASNGLLPTGTVTFSIDGVAKATVNLASGVATYTNATLTASATGHTITAKYNGATNYATSTGTYKQVVVNPGTTLANVTVSTATNPSQVNTAVLFAASVIDPNGGTPTGYVQFKIDTTLSPFIALDGAGNANYTYKFTTVATHPVIVYYYGDVTYAAGHSTTWNQIVTSVPPTSLKASIASNNQVNPTYTLTVNAMTNPTTLDSTYNGPVSFTVVSAPAGGAITGPNSTNFVGGVARFTNLKITADGTYTVEIVSGELVLDFTFTISGGRVQ
jgi:hypothetical protein